MVSITKYISTIVYTCLSIITFNDYSKLKVVLKYGTDLLSIKILLSKIKDKMKSRTPDYYISTTFQVNEGLPHLTWFIID